MSNQVLVKNGVYAKSPIQDQVFDLVRPLSAGKNGYFVTVDGSELTGQPGRNIRILVEGPQDVEYHGVSQAEVVKPVRITETDEEAKSRIRKRFQILDQMADATAKGIVRGLIVSGPPGVGKSFGVETVLNEYEAMHKLSGGQHACTEVVKGSMTPIGLYQTLYNNSDRGNILVFDDCDSILFDEVCLNMLKAVLDSGKKRTISWKAESAALRREGIPDRFDFAGGVIFITNVNFENVRSKKIQDHLEALMSRCHYIDLEMDSERDRFLRIEQIVADGMLDEYKFGDEGNLEVVDFMKSNAARLREISLRMVLKISDLRAMSPDNWQELAKSTCMKRPG
jgi:hypothetical protein